MKTATRSLNIVGAKVNHYLDILQNDSCLEILQHNLLFKDDYFLKTMQLYFGNDNVLKIESEFIKQLMPDFLQSIADIKNSYHYKTVVDINGSTPFIRVIIINSKDVELININFFEYNSNALIFDKRNELNKEIEKLQMHINKLKDYLQNDNDFKSLTYLYNNDYISDFQFIKMSLFKNKKRKKSMQQKKENTLSEIKMTEKMIKEETLKLNIIDNNLIELRDQTRTIQNKLKEIGVLNYDYTNEKRKANK